MMQMLAGIFGLGTGEMIAIGVIVLVLFGANKLPELARGLGKSLGEFKKAKKELEDELNAADKPTAAKTEEPTPVIPSPPKESVEKDDSNPPQAS